MSRTRRVAGWSMAADIVGAASLVAMVSCTTITGTRTPTGREAISRVQRVGILVKKEEEFSVRVSRERATATGAALGGLLGAAIEAGARAHSDEQQTEPLRPVLGTHDPARSLGENLQRYLVAYSVFQRATRIEADDAPAIQRREIDGILEVLLMEWGFQLCRGPGAGKTVQAGFRIHARLAALPTREVVWERDELYLDGECRTLGELRSADGLLMTVLARSIDHLAAKLVNEIRFP